MQDATLEVLKSGKNVFLTGSAGTGKTYLLNKYITYLKQRKIQPTIVAPTGIAASHLQGQTLHSYFALGIRDSIDDYFIENLLDKKYLQTRFSKLKVLIIDEISMVSPEIFSSIDMIIQAFKNNYEPFGGIQVILSGDFFQLPPISKGFKDKKFAWQSPSWKNLDLNTCYLEKKFRQEDNKLISILDEIRAGKISKTTYDILNSRCNVTLDIDFTPTKLYTHNLDVDNINSKELFKLPNESYKYKYESDGSKANIEKIFKSSLVLEEITLKKDAVVMFIKNNPEKAYINGSTGVVIDFTKDTKLPIVKLTNGYTIKVEYEDWTIENDKGKVTAKISQLPLKLAWAITIHKSQGMTLDAAQIDLSKTFEVGQGYVALSRIKNIDGLQLLGFNETALMVDPLILSIDNRIKQASKKTHDMILKYSQDDIKNLQTLHIKLNGGITNINEIKEETKSLNKKRLYEPKITTFEKTQNLIAKSNTLKDLAKNRDVSFNTIVNHIKILLIDDENIDIEKYKPDKSIINKVSSIVNMLKTKNKKDDFSENNQLKLKPIFEALNQEISYDDIKVSLLFIK